MRTSQPPHRGLSGTLRWRISHIRQPAQEEGSFVAEIGPERRFRNICSRAARCRRARRGNGTAKALAPKNQFREAFQSDLSCRSGWSKISLPFFRNLWFYLPVPTRIEGRVATVTSVGLECDGRGRLRQTGEAQADGEVVWSWHPWAGAKCAGDDPRMTVTKRSRTPGRARSKPKTIAQGKPT